MWVRALGLTDTSTARSARGLVSKIMRRLGDRKLIDRGRSGRLLAITLLREDGSGQPYEDPFAEGSYFSLPHAYWLEQHYRTLSLAAKVMLLIALSLQDDFYLAYERAKAWYGISADTAGRGLRELVAAGILVAERAWVKNHRSDTGWIEERHYRLTGPYAKERPDSTHRTDIARSASGHPPPDAAPAEAGAA
jgi:hypothetical protein